MSIQKSERLAAFPRLSLPFHSDTGMCLEWMEGVLSDIDSLASSGDTDGVMRACKLVTERIESALHAAHAESALHAASGSGTLSGDAASVEHQQTNGPLLDRGGQERGFRHGIPAGKLSPAAISLLRATKGATATRKKARAKARRRRGRRLKRRR